MRMRVEWVALGILVPLVLVLGAVLNSWPAGIETSSETRAPAVAGRVQQSVTLGIERSGEEVDYEVAVEGEVTVQKVLERAVQQHNLQIDVKDYGEELGIFVEAINGVAGDSDSGMYWHLYINNVLSPVGASAAMVGSGDAVTWKYEEQHEEN